MRRWLLLPLLLGACATEPPLEVRLQPLVGKTEVELVQTLGVPNANTVAMSAEAEIEPVIA